MKKKSMIFILSLIFCFCALPSLASAASAGEDFSIPDKLYERTLSSTKQSLVRIIRPEGNETTTKKSYIVSGSANQKNLVVQLMRRNSEGDFEPLYNSEGRSNWEIGPSGLFMKEIKLNEGPNRIRISVYKKGEESDLRLGDNWQLNDFTINYLTENVINSIFNLDIGNMFK